METGTKQIWIRRGYSRRSPECPSAHLAARGPSLKTKNYQTNPFRHPKLFYNHNGLCLSSTKPSRKTNPNPKLLHSENSTFRVLCRNHRNFGSIQDRTIIRDFRLPRPLGGEGRGEGASSCDVVQPFFPLGFIWFSTEHVQSSAFDVRCSRPHQIPPPFPTRWIKVNQP